MIKKLVNYLAVFCLAFTVAGSAGYLGVSLFTRSAPEIILPELTGKNIIDVLETLTRLGLNPKLYGTRYHETIPKYAVTHQDPEPGATIKKGRDIILYISKGFKEVQMPDLRQVALNQGLIRLEAGEIRTGKLLYIHSDTAPGGTIIAQYPLPGRDIPAASTADLLVSKGALSPDRVMPDLIGHPLTQAAVQLADLGLKPGTIRSAHEARKPTGTILSQEPEAGGRIGSGLPVQLVVNKPGETTDMDPVHLNTPTLISFRIPMGFSNRHIRVATDMFGSDTDLYNTYMKPGKMINLLIPAGIKTKIRIFIDHKLVQVRTIGPWQPDAGHAAWTFLPGTGDLLWE